MGEHVKLAKSALIVFPNCFLHETHWCQNFQHKSFRVMWRCHVATMFYTYVNTSSINMTTLDLQSLKQKEGQEEKKAKYGYMQTSHLGQQRDSQWKILGVPKVAFKDETSTKA